MVDGITTGAVKCRRKSGKTYKEGLFMDEIFSAQGKTEKTALPIRYQKNYSVTQANELVRSRQDELTIFEAKLVRLAISQILKEDTDLQTYTCNAAKLAELLGITRQAVYKSNLDEISSSLMRKIIYIRERGKKDGAYKKFHWVDYAEYKNGNITIKLSEYLKPYLLGLNELFTSYTYEEILKLPTNYAIRLYELLCSYSSIAGQNEKNEIIFDIDFLREYFNCTNKYPQTGDFIKRVIEAGKADIINNTNLPCRYEPIKERNKITKIRFIIGDWDSEEGKAIIKRLRGQVPGEPKQ